MIRSGLPIRVQLFIRRHVTFSHQETFWKELGKARFWLVFFGMMWLSHMLGQTRPVHVASLSLWDGIEQSFTKVDRKTASRYHIVQITQDDYDTFFRSRSPLDSDALAKLIATAMRRKARSVVVDIDTSDAKFVTMPRRISYLLHAYKCGTSADCQSVAACGAVGNGRCYLPEQTAIGLPPNERKGEPYEEVMDLSEELEEVRSSVIWARGAVPPVAAKAGFRLLPALGRSGTHQADPDRSGVVMLQPDTDGRLRKVIPTFVLDPSGTFQSLPQTVSTLGSQTTESDSDDAEQFEPNRLRFVAYLRQMPIESASEFLERTHSLVEKNVFIGGAWTNADSFYMQDGFDHPGVEVLAAASAALSDGAIVHEFGQWELAIDFALGIITAFVHHKFRPAPALLVLLAFLALGSFAFVQIGLTLGYTLDLAAFLVGIALGESTEAALKSEPEPTTIIETVSLVREIEIGS